MNEKILEAKRLIQEVEALVRYEGKRTEDGLLVRTAIRNKMYEAAQCFIDAHEKGI